MYEVRVNRKWLIAAGLREAQALVNVRNRQQGSREWYDHGPEVGNVRKASTGRVVAHISYNGRVWQPGKPGEMTPEITNLDAAL